MKFALAIKICYAIEEKHNFHSNQLYSIEKDPQLIEKKGECEDGVWVVKITFPESTEYWDIQVVAKSIEAISKEIEIKIIWEKRQFVLDVHYYDHEVNESLDKQLKELQLDDSKEHKESEEIGH